MEITLTAHERELILKYGHPSPSLEKRLRQHRDADPDAPLTLGDFEPAHIAGAFRMLLKEHKIPADDLDDVNGLCEYLERL